MAFVDWVLQDPGSGLKGGRLKTAIAPVVSYFVIPGLERLRILHEINMLGPALEALYRLQTFLEGLD